MGKARPHAGGRRRRGGEVAAHRLLALVKESREVLRGPLVRERDEDGEDSDELRLLAQNDHLSLNERDREQEADAALHAPVREDARRLLGGRGDRLRLLAPRRRRVECPERRGGVHAKRRAGARRRAARAMDHTALRPVSSALGASVRLRRAPGWGLRSYQARSAPTLIGLEMARARHHAAMPRSRRRDGEPR